MNVKTILGGLVAFLSALAYGLFQKSRREEEKRKGIEKAREVETKATDALTAGLTNEQKELKDARSRTGRDHFS